MEKETARSTQSTNNNSESSMKNTSLSLKRKKSEETLSNSSLALEKDFSIPKTRFNRLVTSLSGDFRWKKSALESLHYAAEAYLESLFEDTNLVITHCKRRTLYVKDMTLARRIRGYHSEN